VDHADLRQPDLLRQAQELIREVIQSNPYPIVALNHQPGIPSVKIISPDGT
jgi:hypothetical protein